jgi:hypothetical protein
MKIRKSSWKERDVKEVSERIHLNLFYLPGFCKIGKEEGNKKAEAARKLRINLIYFFKKFLLFSFFF